MNFKQKLNNVSDYMYCNFFVVKTNNNNNNNYHYFFLNVGPILINVGAILHGCDSEVEAILINVGTNLQWDDLTRYHGHQSL
jgi:hypothetical protein